MLVRGLGATITVVLLATVLGLAQTPPQQAPAAPTQQQQIMNYFAGDWKLAGTEKISPKGAGAPFTSTEHAEWLPGGYFLEIHSVTKGPLGDVHGTRMMEYNPYQKVYTDNAYNSLGEHTMAEGTVQGSTWIWNSEETLNGVVTKGRYTVNFISPDAYSFKSEVLKPGGGWITVREGKATRAQ
jgi:hypothetical protein